MKHEAFYLHATALPALQRSKRLTYPTMTETIVPGLGNLVPRMKKKIDNPANAFKITIGRVSHSLSQDSSSGSLRYGLSAMEDMRLERLEY